MTSTIPEPQFEAKYRIPTAGKRWKSLGTYATEAEAHAALTTFLADK